MAEIFKGLTYDFSGLKKFIVIKRILPHIAANDDFIRMLVDEAKIAVRLNHGNVAQTFDLGKVAEDYFIVMEYVEGRTVSQLYKKAAAFKESLPIPMATFVVSEICNGLDYIHRRQDESGTSLGIIHCDISPQNVIVSKSGTVKIVDFGVAKAASKLSEKDRGVLKGKFAYMSPEQTEGVHVDSTSDIFSTGVVLWEMLTGRRLFKKKTNTETIEAVNGMAIYPPSAYRNEIPSDLDEIVMKALERNPKKRYPTASDMSLALTKFNLKHYSDFKPLHIGEFIQRIFEDEENTGDIFQEKTQHEEATLHDKDQLRLVSGREEENTPAEDTVIVDPQELDFQSLFEDIEMEDVSEVTQAINLLPQEDPAEEDEPTGDLPSEAAPVPNFGDILIDEEKFPPPVHTETRQLLRRGLIALGGILLIIAIYMVSLMLFSHASAKLSIKVKPEGARVNVDGRALTGGPPYVLKSLKPRTQYQVLVTHEGYVPQVLDIYLFPHWTKDLDLRMKRLSGGIIEVESDPPGAALYIDGQMTGKRTPVLLEAKNLKFPLILGLSQGGPPRWTRPIKRIPKNNLKIQANLNEGFGTLTVQSEPSGAAVFLGGELMGQTPLFSQRILASSPTILRLEMAGYRPYQKSIELKAGQNGILNPALQKNHTR